MVQESTHPKLTVIIAAYNSLATLQRCLESACSQTLDGVQVLVVDDGSDDGTPELARQIIEEASCDGEVICAQHAGPSGARNVGLDHAAGEFVTFLDSDDYVEPDAYQKMWENAHGNDADIVICGRMNEDAATGTVFRERIPSYDVLEGGLLECPQMVRRVGIFVWDKIYRRSLLDDNGVRFCCDLHHGEDFLFITQVLRYARKVSAVREPLYHYWCNRSESLTGAGKHVMDIPRACAMIVDDYERKGLLEATRPYLRHVFFGYYLRRCQGLDDEELPEFKQQMTELFDRAFPGGWRLALARRCIVYNRRQSVASQARVFARAVLP